MDMRDAISIVKNPDYWRFALIMNAPENADTDFTTDGFVESVNKIMNGKIGNLLQRVITLTKANADILNGKAEVNQIVSDKLGALIKKYNAQFENIELREALKTVVEIADLGNSLMSMEEPWVMAKSAKSDKTSAQQFSSIMNALIKICYSVSILVYPFIPSSSGKALKYFGLKEPTLGDLTKTPRLNLEENPKPIFERLTDEQIKKISGYS